MYLKCLFGFHMMTDWKYIQPIGRYEHRIKRRCKRCNKTESYNGQIEKKDNGKYYPFIIK